MSVFMQVSTYTTNIRVLLENWMEIIGKAVEHNADLEVIFI